MAPPSVAADEPSYEPGGGRGPIRRYWRGPTWVNSAWLVWLGLRRLGYAEQAARLAAGVLGAAVREGLREYYDPRTAGASAPRTSPGRRWSPSWPIRDSDTAAANTKQVEGRREGGEGSALQCVTRASRPRTARAPVAAAAYL